jgi:hypothetical protein
MHDTLSPLVDRALAGNRRPLEFYLREQSHLPGPRANLELVNDLSHLLAVLAPVQSDNVHMLLNHLVHNHYKAIESNTPDEFVMLCGVVAFGACAAKRPEWRGETVEFLDRCAASSSWRVREGVAIAFQRLLCTAPREILDHLTTLAYTGDYLQQRAAIAAIAEPGLLNTPDMVSEALNIQRMVLEHLHRAPAADRKRENFRALRKALGYTLSVVTAATPKDGFALMRMCAGWGDADVVWVLRENLKKKRLAKYVEHVEELARLLAE